MQGALIILLATVLIGLLLFITDKTYFRHHHGQPQEPKNAEDNGESAATNESHGEFCCGQHLICEKTGLSPVSGEILYYDDEELDRFVGRTPESYTTEEIEEFRDILLTLLPQDVPGWARSITLRRIELPDEIREELLMIASELRFS